MLVIKHPQPEGSIGPSLMHGPGKWAIMVKHQRARISSTRAEKFRGLGVDAQTAKMAHAKRPWPE